MAIHQCSRCELRFRSESELNHHLTTEHDVDVSRREPFAYRSAREQKPLYPDLVDGADDKRHQVLILSNATLRAERLEDHVGSQAGDVDTLFLLVVPAVTTSDVLPRAGSFATVGDPAHPSEHTLSGEMLAQHRLDEALARLRAKGLQIEGMVGDSDPLRAVADGLGQFQADEILVSTLPQPQSRWLAVDLPTEIRRRFNVPVTVVTAG